MDCWKIDYAQLQIGDKIGAGSYGRVHKGTFLGSPVAIKKLLNVEREEMRSYFEREISVLIGASHPNIIRLQGVCITDKDIYLVTEIAEGGELAKRLKPKDKKTRRLRLTEKVLILKQVAQAMAFLHDFKNVLHRDLKPSNILLKGGIEGLSVRVCDFGLARRIAPDSKMTVVGDCLYMAPELLSGSPYYNKPADVFSFGVVLWQVLTEKEPQQRNTINKFQFSPGAKPKKVPDVLWDLITPCTKKKARKRPTFIAIIGILEEVELALSSHGEDKEASEENISGPSPLPEEKAGDLSSLEEKQKQLSTGEDKGV